MSAPRRIEKKTAFARNDISRVEVLISANHHQLSTATYIAHILSLLGSGRTSIGKNAVEHRPYQPQHKSDNKARATMTVHYSSGLRQQHEKKQLWYLRTTLPIPRCSKTIGAAMHTVSLLICPERQTCSTQSMLNFP